MDHGNVGVAGILVKELEPGLLKDYLRFFDSEAFTDNESWSGCYCGFFDDPCPDQDWDAGVESGSAHRMARIDRIRKGLARGLLAYSNGKPIGWCNAAPRSSYINLRRYAVAVETPAAPVGSIMCFIVSPAYRRKGVSAALLHHACKMFRRLGLEVAEGYPRTQPSSDDESWAASNYHGSLEMFRGAGFNVSRQFEKFAVVRKNL